MWRGVFALFFRSLRIDARSLRMHLMWFLLAVVIYLALWNAQGMSSMFGAPGLLFFRNVMYLNAAFITLLGISLFSSAISEEKEEDTLGLMTMAGISPLGILMGKSTSRLFQVLLLLAIQYPFTLLAVTLGGLMPGQIYSAYMSLLSYTMLLANVGLLCSVACRTNRNASGLTTFWLLGYVALPLFAWGGYMYLTMDRGWTGDTLQRKTVLKTLEWAGQSMVFRELYHATETGHEFTWSVQIVSNAVGAVICFLLSWLLFGFVAKEPAPETSSRGMVARRTNRALRWFSAGRVWNHSLVWKDFFFIAGGWAGIVVRCGLYVSLFGLCYGANRGWNTYPGWVMRWEDVTFGFQFFGHPLLALDIALCISRVFHTEIRGQTLSSLLMLPISIPGLVYGKLAGCGLAVLPGVIAILLSIVAMPSGTKALEELIDEPGFWWWIMNLFLVIHLTALFSLYLRTGAFALALGTMFGSMFATGMILSMIAMATRGGGRDMEVLLGMCAVGLGLVCVGCHAVILMRMPVLGEK
jgi:ABC-type transport system involved in multi-copper enzyme maturation permease subunit